MHNARQHSLDGETDGAHYAWQKYTETIFYVSMNDIYIHASC